MPEILGTSDQVPSSKELQGKFAKNTSEFHLFNEKLSSISNIFSIIYH